MNGNTEFKVKDNELKEKFKVRIFHENEINDELAEQK